LSANGRIGDAQKVSRILVGFGSRCCLLLCSIQVIATFEDLIGAGKGNVDATVTSAEPLSKEALEQVKKAISGLTGKGARVDLKAEVDPKILGGLKVVVGDRSIDLTVASRVNELSAALDSQ
jgi:F-type H+-transporting ATPase subunit O